MLGIGPGFHEINIFGMDANNNSFLNTSAFIFAGEHFDFGDAPDDNYKTVLGSNGPRHRLDARLYMGDDAEPLDGELDGAPGLGADRDDTSLTDDEDGIASFDPLVIDDIGQPYSVDVTVTNTLPDDADDATLICWIDFDRDGEFGDFASGEESNPVFGDRQPSGAKVNWNGIPADTVGRADLRALPPVLGSNVRSHTDAGGRSPRRRSRGLPAHHSRRVHRDQFRRAPERGSGSSVPPGP